MIERLKNEKIEKLENLFLNPERTGCCFDLLLMKLKPRLCSPIEIMLHSERHSLRQSKRITTYRISILTY